MSKALRSRKYACVAVAALCLASSHPSLAQDGSEGVALRSPENAQKFLAAMAQQYELSISPTPWENTDDPHDTDVRYNPITISSDSVCTTVISGPVDSFGTNYLPEHQGGNRGNPAEVFARHKSEVESRGVQTAPFTLDWGKITRIGTLSTTNPALNSTITVPRGIIIVEGNARFLLGAPTDEIASRMRRAMETLKDACDKTSGLGY